MRGPQSVRKRPGVRQMQASLIQLGIQQGPFLDFGLPLDPESNARLQACRPVEWGDQRCLDA